MSTVTRSMRSSPFFSIASHSRLQYLESAVDDLDEPSQSRMSRGTHIFTTYPYSSRCFLSNADRSRCMTSAAFSPPLVSPFVGIFVEVSIPVKWIHWTWVLPSCFFVCVTP